MSAWSVGAVVGAIALTVLVLRIGQLVLRPDPRRPQVRVLGMYSPVLTWLRHQRRATRPLSLAAVRAAVDWAALAELGLLTAWAVWVGRLYLDLNPRTWVWGGDWVMNVQAYFPWQLLRECGACVFWNGYLNGGAPSFIHLVPAILHPFVIAAATAVGAVNATKLMMIAAMLMAGVAQWWLARVLGLGRVARLWAGALAVVGGHLSGRMEAGLVEEAFSAAACALVIPPALDLALTGRRRSAVWFGVWLGLALLAGQAYMQIALLAGVLPGLALFLFDENLRLRPVWREFALGGAIAALLAAALWVPFLHFAGNFIKPTDPTFASAQPLEYLLLNLVIRDPEYFRSLALKPFTFPSWYANYVGWVPVLLALLAFYFAPRAQRKTVAFLGISFGLVYWLASALPLQWLAAWPPDVAGGIRTPTVMQSVAVPSLLGLAAWGLDGLLRHKDWRLVLRAGPGRELAVSVIWLAVLPALAWSLKTAYDFGRHWMLLGPGLDQAYVALDKLRPDSAQWLNPPGGEVAFALAGAELGLKTTNTTEPWYWRDRVYPPAQRGITRDPVDTATATLLESYDGLNLVEYPGSGYAYVQTESGQIPCQAEARGGDIDVYCASFEAGTLVVQENTWSGWQATRDGVAATLLPGPWLSLAKPAGAAHIAFRYRPWDVPLGFLLSLGGVALAVWAARRRPDLAATTRDA